MRRSVSWRPDGSMLVSGADDNSARIWHKDSGELLCLLTGCEGWVNCVAWSPDNQTIACASADGFVHLYDSMTGIRLESLPNGDWVQTVAWSQDGSFLASGTYGDEKPACVYIWHQNQPLKDGRQENVTHSAEDYHGTYDCKSNIQQELGGNQVGLSHNAGDCRSNVEKKRKLQSNSNAVLHEGGHSRPCWSLLHRLTIHEGPINCVAWSVTNTMLASASDDGSLAIWDGMSGNLLHRICDVHGEVRSVHWSKTGQWVACAWADTVRLYNLANLLPGVEITAQVIFCGHMESVLAVEWSPDNTALLSSSRDHTVRLWSIPVSLQSNTDNTTDVRNDELCSDKISMAESDHKNQNLEGGVVVDKKRPAIVNLCVSGDEIDECADPHPGSDHNIAIDKEKVHPEAPNDQALLFNPAPSMNSNIAFDSHPIHGVHSPSCSPRTVDSTNTVMSSDLVAKKPLISKVSLASFELDSAVYSLSWHVTSGVCCACSNGRIVQLGVVIPDHGGGNRQPQLKWNKSFRRSKRVASKPPTVILPSISEALIERSPGSRTKHSGKPGNKSQMCAIL